MASNLSSLGFNVNNKKEFIDLVKMTYENAEFIKCKRGQYAKWSVDENVKLYGQLDNKDCAIGMNPHFYGESRQIVNIEAINKKSKDTALDGSFRCWACPTDDLKGGLFPFIFDCPDAKMHIDIKLPQKVEVQIAAIAHDITIFENEQAFFQSQDSETKFSSESFIPSGMFNVDNNKKNDLEAIAIINGRVISAQKMINSYTNLEYVYLIVEVQGCRFDVVVDKSLIDQKPKVGNIVSGSFWLSGTIQGEYTKKQGILSKLFSS